MIIMRSTIITKSVVLLILIVSIKSTVECKEYAKNEILKLTDKTFEKETQAATGQTTGKWLIYFDVHHSYNEFLTPTLKATLKKLDKEQKGEEYRGERFVAAEINVDEEYFTRARFDGFIEFPSLVYFERQQMRVFDADHTAAGKSVVDVKQWMRSIDARFMNVPKTLSAIGVMRVYKEQKMKALHGYSLRVRRDSKHWMRAFREAGIDYALAQMHESVTISPKLYGSILIACALGMITFFVAMSKLVRSSSGDSKRKAE
jgi:hypothetical protein